MDLYDAKILKGIAGVREVLRAYYGDNSRIVIQEPSYEIPIIINRRGRLIIRVPKKEEKEYEVRIGNIEDIVSIHRNHGKVIYRDREIRVRNYDGPLVALLSRDAIIVYDGRNCVKLKGEPEFEEPHLAILGDYKIILVRLKKVQ